MTAEPTRASTHLPFRSALVLFLLALAPRLLLVGIFLHAPIGLDDMFQYDMLARSLAGGHGYRWYGRADVARMRPYLEAYYDVELPTEQVPEEGLLTTFRAPGYPLFLAGIYATLALEARLAASRLAQALLGAALAPLTAWLALLLGLSLSAARRAGVVAALYPILWLYPIGLASENTFIPLVLLGLIALLLVERRGRMHHALAAGLALGAATLTRGALAPFLPLAALWLWSPLGRPASPRPARFRLAMAFTVSASLVLVPWMVRNSLILGRLAFVENSAGYNLFVGYHPGGDGGLDGEVSVIPLRFMDDGERDRWSRAQALKFIRADPGRALALLPRRLAYFWGPEDRELVYFYSNDYVGPISQPWLALAYGVLVLPLLAVGISAPFGMALATDARARRLTLGLIAAALIAYVPILAEPRFHLPLIPVLAAYAAGLWTTRGAASQIFGAAGRGEGRVWLALAAAALFTALWAWDLAREWPELMAVMSPGGNSLHLAY